MEKVENDDINIYWIGYKNNDNIDAEHQKIRMYQYVRNSSTQTHNGQQTNGSFPSGIQV